MSDTTTECPACRNLPPGIGPGWICPFGHQIGTAEQQTTHRWLPRQVDFTNSEGKIQITITPDELARGWSGKIGAQLEEMSRDIAASHDRKIQITIELGPLSLMRRAATDPVTTVFISSEHGFPE
jgi:hypothetical protein